MLNRKTNRRDAAPLRAKCFGAIALVGVAASAVMTTPGLIGASTTRAASSICSKVPASKVAAIVGYSVPAGQVSTVTLPATKTNYEISTTNTSCTYGSVASLATLSKVVILTIDTTTKALTPAEFKASLAKLASDGVKMTLKSYSGLGANAYYFTESVSGTTTEGLSVINGTHGFGAAVESNKLSQAKLAQLTKLAGSL
ncbi:MAG TPA: hypothetical protein VIJ34_04310 [Acidimicrobiales bacterium]